MSMFTDQINRPPLAVAVRDRRHELGLSLPAAAELAGMTVSRWLALEAGTWIPAERSDMRAIADTLEGNVTVVSMLAFFSQYYDAA